MESVDIIMPVYNGEATIGAAIESVAAQTVAHLCRLIIVDDASTDSTLDVVQRYMIAMPALAERCKVVALGTNRGAAEAYNAGLKSGNSHWIARCDADDEMMPDAIERMLELANKKGADIVVGPVEQVNGKKSIVLRPSLTGGLNSMPLDTVNFGLCNKLIKRTLCMMAPDGKPLSVLPGINCWDDVSFVARLMALPGCRVEELSGKSVYRYNRHAGQTSLSRASRQYQLEQHLQCALQLTEWFQANELSAIYEPFLLRLKFLSKVKLLRGQGAASRIAEWRDTFRETSAYIMKMSPDMSLPLRIVFRLLSL